MSKSNQQPAVADPTTGEVNVPAIQEALATMFSKVLTLRDLTDNRNRCFGMVANFRSPKTQIIVADVLNRDEIGDVLNRIRDAKLASVAGSSDFGF